MPADPPTVPGQSDRLYTGYPEKGRTDIPPREPSVTAQQGTKTREPPRADEGTYTRETPYYREKSIENALRLTRRLRKPRT